MQYKLKNSGLTVSITERDYIAEGGEAKVYAKSGVGYKIGKPIPDGKFAELAVLDKDFIIKPKDIVLSNGKPVGYTMRFLPPDEIWQLPLLNTNTFWQREAVTTDKMLKLIQFMRDGFAFVHSKDILLVDANPFNFLAKRSLDEVYFIDTNSYQTPSYPATAIMPVIRDRKTTKFSELSDWFSFAVVTFELLVGISPFRGGNCPGIDGDADTRMIQRMDKNISVLNPKVKFPKNAIRPLSSMPQSYMDWYTGVFEQGKRVPPPLDFVSLTHVAKVATIRDSVKMNLKELFTADEDITGLQYTSGKQVVITKSFIYVDGNKTANKLPTKNLFIYNRQLHSIDGYIYNLIKQEKCGDDKFQATKIVNETPYTKHGDSLRLFGFRDIGGRVLASTLEIAKVMPQTTFMFDGIVGHNIGGSNYFVCLPDGKRSYQLRVKELDGHQIIEGKGFGNIAIVFAKKGNLITKHKITFSSDYDSYDITSEPSEIYSWQAVLLDTGILVETTPEGHLRLSKGNSARIVEDPWLLDNIFLAQNGPSVIVAKGKTVFQLSLK